MVRSIHSAHHVVTNRVQIIDHIDHIDPEVGHTILQPLKACAESIIGRGKTRQITVDMHKPGDPASCAFLAKASSCAVDLNYSSIEHS